MDTPDVESVGASAESVESLGALESRGACTALPSAVAEASVFAAVESVKRPPAWTVTLPIVARETVFARLIATAAATETPPDDVDAPGVASPPSPPVAPVLDRVEPAKLRSRAT